MAESHTVDIDGLCIHAEVDGDGPPIVVLHGFLGSGRAMRSLTSRLAGRTIAVDLVGHGRSDAPHGTEAYTMSAMVDQVHQVVDDIVGAAPVAVVGYSMGARVALSFAATHPATVHRLVSIGGTAGIADSDAAAARRRADEALADKIDADGVRAFVDYWETVPIFSSQLDLAPEKRRAIRAHRLDQRAHGLSGHLRAAGTGAMASLWGDLASIAIPTLLVVGHLDTKFRRIAEEMAVLMPAVDVAVVADVGHAAHTEAPQAVADLVNSYLAP